MESRASRRRTSSETGIVACTWEAASSASAARCNHWALKITTSLTAKSDSLRLLRLLLGWGPVRLPDRKQDSAHNVLGYAAVAKLIQLEGVLSSVGSLLGQVPDSLGPKDERDRIRASYCLDGGYHSVVARITRKARRVLRVDQDHIDVMFFQPLHGFVERPRKLL